MHSEPITFLYNKYNFKPATIKKIVFGKSYVAVMLMNGNIGLSANLYDIKNVNINELQKPNFTNSGHRNILSAYYNAVFNNKKEYSLKSDIFNLIDFKKYPNLVMIGFSEPIYKKLIAINIKPFVFDYSSDNKVVISQTKQAKYLKKADSVLLTSTSVLNNTFFDIVKNTKIECDIFMFGPSTFMSKDFFRYKNIKGLFGTVFNSGDNDVIKLIEEGQGNRYLKKKGKKVALLNNF